MLRGVVRLELVVVSEVHELVRVGAAAQVARLVRGLHVVVQRALVVEALAAAEFTRGVARERPEGLVHLPRGAVVVAVELRSGVQELLRDEHLAPLHARVAVVELVLLPEVRAELLEARVVRHALRDPAVGRHARGALQTAELLHPAPHRAVVEEDVERLVAPELAARDAPRQRLEPGLPAERLRVRPDVPRREHPRALLLADDAPPVVHDEAQARDALHARVAVPAGAARDELQRLRADHAALLHRDPGRGEPDASQPPRGGEVRGSVGGRVWSHSCSACARRATRLLIRHLLLAAEIAALEESRPVPIATRALSRAVGVVEIRRSSPIDRSLDARFGTREIHPLASTPPRRAPPHRPLRLRYTRAARASAVCCCDVSRPRARTRASHAPRPDPPSRPRRRVARPRRRRFVPRESSRAPPRSRSRRDPRRLAPRSRVRRRESFDASVRTPSWRAAARGSPRRRRPPGASPDAPPPTPPRRFPERRGEGRERGR